MQDIYFTQFASEQIFDELKAEEEEDEEAFE